MLKSRKEIQEFIKMLFGSSEIVINDVPATNEDLVVLCEQVSRGYENIKNQKQYISSGRITKIEIKTF